MSADPNERPGNDVDPPGEKEPVKGPDEGIDESSGEEALPDGEPEDDHYAGQGIPPERGEPA
jgi:hypothetical protein